MRTIIVRLADAGATDDQLHGIVEVPGGARRSFGGDDALLRLLRELDQVSDTTVSGIPVSGIPVSGTPVALDGTGSTGPLEAIAPLPDLTRPDPT